MLLGVTVVLGCSLVITEPAALASSLTDLKREQEILNQKANQLNSNISEKQGDIKVNQTKQEQLLAQIQSLNAKIIQTDSEIDLVIGEIKQTTEKLRR